MLQFLLAVMVLSLPMVYNPISLGVMIMGLVSLSSILISFNISSWYGYALFLVFVGGVLVMFMYVAALSPNMLFSGSWAIVGIIVLSAFFMKDEVKMVLSKCVSDSWFLEEMPYVITYSSGHIALLGIVLFVTLVAVVKVSQKSGALCSWN